MSLQILPFTRHARQPAARPPQHGPSGAVVRLIAGRAPVSRQDRAPYERSRDLASLLPLWSSEIADESPQGRVLVIARLRRALREERRRGKAGHWAYDLARHWALYRAYRCELAAAGEALEPDD